MTTRAERRRQQREDKPGVTGFTAGQLKEAEAELALGDSAHESSHATTIAVLAHSWFAIDHQREASRVTYQRIVELRKGGREMKTDAIVQQYAEAKTEIVIVEDQIKTLLKVVVDQENAETALQLLGHSHMNMMTNIGVRFPEGIRDRLAREAGIIEPED